MKRGKHILILLTASVMLPLCAAIEFAQGVLCKETVGDIEWSFVAGDNRAVVGSSQILVSAINPATEGRVVVPSTLGGYPVVGIDPYAFSGCEKLTSVTIPNGVTNIGTYAWLQCHALEHVSLPKTVQNFGTAVFKSCVSLKECVLPDAATTVGRDLFWRCTSITNIHFPANVTFIGWMTCYQCASLRSVDLPPNIVEIDGSAFNGCSNLVIDRLPDSLEVIGPSCFAKCEKMPCLTLPKSLRHIENGAFGGCPLFTELKIDPVNPNFAVEGGILYNRDKTQIEYVLENIVISSLPDTLTEIPASAFARRTIDLDKIPDSVRTIGASAFVNCVGTKRMSLPRGLESVGKQAFYGTGGLLADEIVLDEVGTIDEETFRGCTGIKSLVLNKKGVSIGMNAFYGCTGLESVTLPSGVSVGIRAFINCTSMTKLHIPEDFAAVESTAFDGCTGFGGPIVSNGMLVGLPARHIDEFIVPEGVTRLAAYALADYPITNLVLSTTLTNIDRTAVIEMSSLRELQVPGNLTCLKEDLFGDSRNLKTIVILDGGVRYRLPLAEFASIAQPLEDTFKMRRDGICSKYWQEYVQGTDPLNPRDVFTVRIVMDSGEPVVTWSPDLSGSADNRRVYRLLGKMLLDDEEWTPVAECETDRFRFFRVSVMMP